ncbi:GIY-YIG nuclease family protein [Mucilaginibacter ximonensis]|uniref:GIY-YIG nuclease family protein n=1 Tax=Mucilaginibacter ximonensis TaxID=538021 RepID=A0ABW5YAY9_9SPHI
MISLQLYLLELRDGKYYVGQSSRPEVRFSDHQIGQGGKWTRLYPPQALLKTKTIQVEDLREACLYENWLTLHYMEQYGWQNVRGGEYLDIENERIAEKISHIYDLNTNKIRQYIPDCPYLFGATHHWLVYVLELSDGYYYIGSGKRLGKALGDHFNGQTIAFTREHPPLKVAEWQVIKPENGNYLEFKRSLAEQYRQCYGKNKVVAGNIS